MKMKAFVIRNLKSLSGSSCPSRLPAFKTTSVELTPDRPGEFAFTCGMSMMRGKLVVEPRAS